MELTTRPNNTQQVQTMEESLKGLDRVVRTRVFSSCLSCPFQDRVVQTFAFSSCPSCIKTCHLRPTSPLLTQDLSTVNDSTTSFLPPFLVNSAIFFMLPFSNNHPLSLSWKDSHHMRTMSPFKVLFAFFITYLRPRFT